MATQDDRRVIVPNGKLANDAVTNHSTKEEVSSSYRFSIGYADNLVETRRVLPYAVREQPRFKFLRRVREIALTSTLPSEFAYRRPWRGAPLTIHYS